MSDQEKFPKCGGAVTYYQVTQLNVKDGPHDRHIGCGADEGKCLLAKKSWTFGQWEELKAVLGNRESDNRKREEVFALAVAMKASGRLDRLIGKSALEVWHNVNDALEDDQ